MKVLHSFDARAIHAATTAPAVWAHALPPEPFRLLPLIITRISHSQVSLWLFSLRVPECAYVWPARYAARAGPCRSHFFDPFQRERRHYGSANKRACLQRQALLFDLIGQVAISRIEVFVVKLPLIPIILTGAVPVCGAMVAGPLPGALEMILRFALVFVALG